MVVVKAAKGHEELEQVCRGTPFTKLEPLGRDIKRVCVTRPARPGPVGKNSHPLAQHRLEGLDVCHSRFEQSLPRFPVGRDRFIRGDGEPQSADHVGPREVARGARRAGPLQPVGAILDRQARVHDPGS